jgi:hypothetical protein
MSKVVLWFVIGTLVSTEARITVNKVSCYNINYYVRFKELRVALSK